jgi:hypothetical protein
MDGMSNVAQYVQHGAKEQEKKGTGYLVEKLCLEQTLLSKQTKPNHHHERCETRFFSPYPRTRQPERRPSIRRYTPIRWPCYHEVFYCLIYEHVKNRIAKTTAKNVSASGTVVLAAAYWLAVQAVPRQYVHKHKILNSMLQQLR